MIKAEPRFELPEDVRTIYRIVTADGRQITPELIAENGGRLADEHGVEWYVPKSLSPLHGVGVIGGMLGAGITPYHGFKNVEQSLWPAFTKSLVDPNLKAGALRTGEATPEARELRIKRTRAFFGTFMTAVAGVADPRVGGQVTYVNRQHAAYRILDPNTGEVYPDQQSSFAFVTELVVGQMLAEFRKHPLSSRFQSAVPKLFHAAQKRIGLGIAPVDNEHFLNAHREKRVIPGNALLQSKYPEVAERLNARIHQVTANTRAVFCKNLGMTPQEFEAGYFDAFERAELFTGTV